MMTECISKAKKRFGISKNGIEKEAVRREKKKKQVESTAA